MLHVIDQPRKSRGHGQFGWQQWLYTSSSSLWDYCFIASKQGEVISFAGSAYVIYASATMTRERVSKARCLLSYDGSFVAFNYVRDHCYFNVTMCWQFSYCVFCNLLCTMFHQLWITCSFVHLSSKVKGCLVTEKFEKFSLNFSISLFVIRVNRLHP